MNQAHETQKAQHNVRIRGSINTDCLLYFLHSFAIPIAVVAP